MGWRVVFFLVLTFAWVQLVCVDGANLPFVRALPSALPSTELAYILPDVVFLSQGQVSLATSHWLLSLKIDIGPYGRQIQLLQQELDSFHASIQVQLAPYLGVPASNSTELHFTAMSLYHVIVTELLKFQSEMTLLQQLHRSIAISFLESVTPESEGEGGHDAVGSSHTAHWVPNSDHVSATEDGTDLDQETNSTYGAGDDGDTYEYHDYEYVDTGANYVGKEDTREDGYQPNPFNYYYGDMDAFLSTYHGRLKQSPKHVKRALLGWLSPVIAGLFGTPSEQTWQLAQANLKTLHKTSEALRQALGHTLQIVDVTNENVQTNRETILNLASELRKTRSELNEILSSLQQKIDSNFRLNSLIEKIQALFHVAKSSLWVAMHQLTLLNVTWHL